MSQRPAALSEIITMSSTEAKPQNYVISLKVGTEWVATKNGSQTISRQFCGFGALESYFKSIIPTNSRVIQIKDVWSGYLHITLVKFSSALPLQPIFTNFSIEAYGLPRISDIEFQSSSIKRLPNENMNPNRANFYTLLRLDQTPSLEEFYNIFQPLQNQILEITEATSWEVRPLNELHVIIRKYSDLPIDPRTLNLKDHPVKLYCTSLRIVRPRGEAISLVSHNGGQWFEGVCEQEGSCSGCHARVDRQWLGYCVGCREFESVRPIWSTLAS